MWKNLLIPLRAVFHAHKLLKYFMYIILDYILLFYIFIIVDFKNIFIV